MKAFFKNVAMAAAGAGFGYAIQYLQTTLPGPTGAIIGTAIAAAVAHWFPQPNADTSR
jgi:hypothetical protein